MLTKCPAEYLPSNFEGENYDGEEITIFAEDLAAAFVELVYRRRYEGSRHA